MNEEWVEELIATATANHARLRQLEDVIAALTSVTQAEGVRVAAASEPPEGQGAADGRAAALRPVMVRARTLGVVSTTLSSMLLCPRARSW